MIKKIIACLTICFIITGLISPVFSDASALPQPNWSDPGISEIINISDLTGWMLNGGTFDVSTYTDAESFMNDYFNARTKTRLVSPGEVQEDFYEVLPGFGINNQLVAGESFSRPLETNRVIASSFRDHTGYGRRFSNEVHNALLSSGSLYDTKIPLLNEVEFANFVGYNHDALRLYSEFFTADDIPEPDPDPDFSFIVNDNDWIPFSSGYLNNIPFVYSSNIVRLSGNSNAMLDSSNKQNYTYYNPNGVSTVNWSTTIYFSNITTINLNYDSNSDRYIANYDGFNKIYINFNTLNTYGIMISQPSNDPYNYFRIYSQLQNAPSFNPSTSFTGLSTAINYIHSHFRHYNLYVDGVLWVLADSSNLSPTITPEFPDAVGGEDLTSTTWPISRPRAPYYTSVPGVLQAIEDAIANDGKLDIDDLKPYLTDSNGDPVPDPIFDPEPIPIPVPDPVNPDVVPGLPILPAIPPDMPGFNGVSVLAEIINFTNQSLPTSLIVTFWGIVFGIVILGLIKILHK